MAMSNIPIIFMLTNQARFPFVTETTKKKNSLNSKLKFYQSQRLRYQNYVVSHL